MRWPGNMDRGELQEALAQAEAERDQLREALGVLYASWRGQKAWIEQRQNLEAENEKLRAENEKLRQSFRSTSAC